MFAGIDVAVKQVLRDCAKTKIVVKLCNQEGLLRKIEAMQTDLNVCQKALDNYLEGKRAAFPRFYFVSTTDLLDILSNGNNPRKIMRHIPKIFQAIKVLKLEGITIVAVENILRICRQGCRRSPDCNRS